MYNILCARDERKRIIWNGPAELGEEKRQWSVKF